eukprot:Cvel_18239.t1-p1 / transcript=Cvel_18239.t1 / gene=Cvel_18239 / organism=Chromera_velia_CCMP2878 / gene_product=hypothetical protein / transcript_product=hypothetical protein / location=Cvel_scaffold1500:84-1301(-) / protein_length=108 / sequence_SO=supercontig / SO=protein_coding / is_pseudo=false
MQKIPGLSSRGNRVLDKGFPYYLPICFRSELFSEQCPKGSVILAIAENKMAFPLLSPKIAQIPWPPPPEFTHYGMATGHMRYREAIASFLSEFVVKKPIGADCISVSA